MAPKTATVVVIEDHVDLCDMYAEMLAAAGFDVLTPRENEDVVALVQELTTPVAVTLDIGVDGAGYELARHCERSGRAPASSPSRAEIPKTSLTPLFSTTT